jgi:peptidoglycan/LPS O-acetylase OafA/YrhL
VLRLFRFRVCRLSREHRGPPDSKKAHVGQEGSSRGVERSCAETGHNSPFSICLARGNGRRSTMDLQRPLPLLRKIDDEAKDRLAPLDGVRALAALAVLCSHTALLPVPFGTLGVLLFFSLSAFLLSRPFIVSDEIYSLRGTAAFFIRRIFRIMPMLIVYVFTYGAFVDGRFGYVIDHIVMFKGTGHLWTINQEMLFYGLMPAFAMLVFPLRGKPLFAAAVFVLLAWVADRYLTYQVFRLPGMTGYMQFFLSPFLVGMMSAYIAPSIKKLALRFVGSPLLNSLVSAVVLACLIFLQWAVVRIYVETGENVTGNWALYMSVGCCALLLWITSAPENWLGAILSLRPLRVIGIVGYSFYLWHWMPVVLLPQEWAPLSRFSTAFVITLSASLASFLIIERPGIRLGATFASMLCRVAGVSEPRTGRHTRGTSLRSLHPE